VKRGGRKTGRERERREKKEGREPEEG